MIQSESGIIVKSKEVSAQSAQMKMMIVAFLSGILFGVAFQLSRVHEFTFVRSQMLFRHEVMLKMFLSACATSTIWLALLPHISSTYRRSVSTGANMMCHIVPQHRGALAASIGGGLIGVGMSMCGSCPGTVYAQLGAGSVKARYIMLGGLIGGLVYPLLELIPQWTRLISKVGNYSWQSYTLPQLVRVMNGHGSTNDPSNSNPIPEYKYSLIFAAVLTIVVIITDILVPWKQDVAVASSTFTISPILAGMIVGSLQLPLITVVGQYLGTSSAYITVMANIWNGVCGALCTPSSWTHSIPLFSALKSNYWQVVLAVGVFCGSWISSHLTLTSFKGDFLISYTEALCGGFILVLGSRIAAGCTSGHGISGMAFLSINSIFTVACMFGGGIATAVLFYA